MPVYDKFQLIAYHVPTDAAPKAQGPYESQLLNAQRINALKADLGDEALNQLTRLVGAVERAQAEPSLGGDNVLKVFLVPEFYFRPQDDVAPRAYSVKQRDTLLGALKEVFCKAAFGHWLLVLGTVVWKEATKNILGQNLVNDVQKAAKDEKDQVKQKQLTADANVLKYGVVVWNTALIVAGGEELYCLDKTVYADADAIPAKHHPNVDSKEGFGRYDDNVKVPLKTYFDNRARQASHRFLLMDGLGCFGTEICMEHQVGVLKKSYADMLKQQGVHAPSLAIQLLTACGMRIHPESVVVDAKRFILKMDGASVPFNGEPRSELQCVMSRQVNQDEAVVVTCESHQGDHTEVWEALNQHEPVQALPDGLKFKVTPGQGIQTFDQELVFFEEQSFEYAAPVQQQQQQQPLQQQGQLQEANAQVVK